MSGGDVNVYASLPLLVTALGTVVASAVTWPFTAVATALVYVDRRMRREALDLELARAAGRATGEPAVPAPVIASAPVELGRDEAARLAREELAKQVYRDAGPGLVERVVQLAARARRPAARRRRPASRRAATPGSWWSCCSSWPPSSRCGSRSGRSAGARRASRRCSRGRARTAAEHRAAADAPRRRRRVGRGGARAAARRRPLAGGARRPRRAARSHRRRGRRRGRRARCPAARPGCAAAARLFDDVWYGGRPAGRQSDAALRALDEQVRAARRSGPARPRMTAPVTRRAAPSAPRSRRRSSTDPTAAELWRAGKGPVAVLLRGPARRCGARPAAGGRRPAAGWTRASPAPSGQRGRSPSCCATRG